MLLYWLQTYDLSFFWFKCYNFLFKLILDLQVPDKVLINTTSLILTDCKIPRYIFFVGNSMHLNRQQSD